MKSYDPCTPPNLQLWDTTWLRDDDAQSISGDWDLSGDALATDNTLATAVFMLIFTDRRAPDTMPLPDDRDDRRGWFGDVVDVRSDYGESDLGSLLWLYERAALTDETIKGIEDTVFECLQPLVDQGMIASREVTVEVDKLENRLCAMINLYAQNGQRVFDARYARVWQQFAPELKARY